MSDLQSRIDYALYMARRDDVLARLARRQGNRAMMALWELYAKQRRAAEAAQLTSYLAQEGVTR